MRCMPALGMELRSLVQCSHYLCPQCCCGWCMRPQQHWGHAAHGSMQHRQHEVGWFGVLWWQGTLQLWAAKVHHAGSAEPPAWSPAAWER